MSTIASLLSLIDPTIRPYAQGAREVADAQRSQTLGQTSLLELADLKAKQQAEQFMLEQIQNDPEVARQLLGGGSIIGSLRTAPAPGPPPGPITQSPLGGGPTQQIPAYPDASRYAEVSPQGGGPLPSGVGMPTVTPPQSTIASLGPAGQPQMPGPQNPLLEMARTNPRAAMMMQDQQVKAFTTQLTIREKTAEAFATKLQGVNSQESYEVAVQDLMQWAPQQAARLPRVWSKEAMQPIIDSALSAKDKATFDIGRVNAQAELQQARMSGRVAKTDQYLKALGVRPGEEQPEDMQKALAWQQRDEIAVSASHGSGQVFQTADGAYRLRPGSNTAEPLSMPGGQPLQPKPTQAEAETATFSNLARKGHEGAASLEQKGFKPGFWDKTADRLPLGIGNYLSSDEHQQYKGYVLDFAQAWLRKTSKGAITEDEWKLVDQRYFPQPGNSKAEIERKNQARADVIKELEAETKGTGRTGSQSPPTSQGSTGSAKPVAQMSAEETRAEIAAIKARGGK